MARRERLANDAETTLSSLANPGDSTIAVQNATDFPTEGDFRVIVDTEIMLVTAVSGSTFTVTRGVEGTSAANHVADSQVAQILTIGGLSTIQYESMDPFAGLRPPYRIMDTNGALIDHTDFTSINPGSTTYTTDANGNIVAEIVTAGAFDFRMLARTAPTPPYTIRAAMVMPNGAIATAGPACGLGFRKTNEQLTMFINQPDGASNLVVNNYTTPSTGLANAITAQIWETGRGGIFWMEIEDDNTDLKFRYSKDGISFSELGTIGRTSHMAGGPDQVVFWVDQTNAGHNQFIKLVAWDGE